MLLDADILSAWELSVYLELVFTGMHTDPWGLRENGPRTPAELVESYEFFPITSHQIRAR